MCEDLKKKIHEKEGYSEDWFYLCFSFWTGYSNTCKKIPEDAALAECGV
jgi:hypothetical protein